MLEVLGEAAFRTLLLTATVQLGLWLLRIRRAQLLLVTWTVVLVCSLAMPALQCATPFRFSLFLAHPAAWLSAVADPRQQVAPAALDPIPAVDAQELRSMSSWLVAAYLLVSGLMVLRLIVGVTLSLRLLCKAAPICLKGAPAARIRISRAVAAPVTVGNVILLPPDVVDWSPAMRQAAVAHECAHASRGDFALLLLSQLYRALFWFSPVSWLLHRRLATLAEFVSDDDAMKVTGERAQYAEVLLEMGRRSGPLLRGLAMARASTLPYRIERILSDQVETSSVSRIERSVIFGAAAIAAFAAASPDFTPGAPENRKARMQTVNALPRSLPIPSQPEDASRPVSQSAASLPRAAWGALQQQSGAQVAARPVSRPMLGETHPIPPVRATQIRNPTNGTQSEVAARKRTELISLPKRSSNSKDLKYPASMSGSGELRHVPLPSEQGSHAPVGEPSLLEVIDQQSCDGVYLPGAVGGSSGGNGWAYVNMLRAKFSRGADGRPWLKIYFGTREPLNLPVQVAGSEVEFTAGNNTSFNLLPRGTNHLTGITQRPEGTIDLACGGAGANLFDRKS